MLCGAPVLNLHCFQHCLAGVYPVSDETTEAHRGETSRPREPTFLVLVLHVSNREKLLQHAESQPSPRMAASNGARTRTGLNWTGNRTASGAAGRH